MWRVIDTGLITGAENITLDAVMLQSRIKNKIPNTFRFLRFKPCALVGYHQVVEQEIREIYCIDNTIDINRRLTGGGAIYFDETQLGWEIIASRDEEIFTCSLENIYRNVCETAAKALRELGVNAKFRPRNDIEIGKKKVSGTGAVEENDIILFQGTLILDMNVDKMLRSLRVPIKKLSDHEILSFKDRITTIKNDLGYSPDINLVKEKILKTFVSEWGWNIKTEKLTEYEKNSYNQKLPYYSSNEWIHKRKILKEKYTLYNIKRFEGGLMKVYLTLTSSGKTIQSAFIAGDFFASPSESIYDFECLLKNVSINKDSISKITNEFFSKDVKIVGIGKEDIITLLMESFEKLILKKFGISMDEINNTSLVNTNVDRLIKEKCDSLLLPYCSKLVDCELRFKEGCIKCGKCTIDDAYRMGEKMDMDIYTIQSFEHLEEVLEILENNKSKGYIGCCCEGFYAKHADDFEKFNIPGILLNISEKSCYDLSKEKEAYLGKFESQTHLNLEHLKKIIELMGNEKV